MKYWNFIASLVVSVLFALSQYYKAGREVAKQALEKTKRKTAEKQAQILEEANEAAQQAQAHGRKELDEELKKAKSGDTSYFER